LGIFRLFFPTNTLHISLIICMLICAVWRLNNPPIKPKEDKLILNGIKRIESGRYRKAYRSVRRAISLNSKNPVSLELLEIVGLRWLPKSASNTDDPVLTLRKLLEKYPQSPYVKILGAEVLLLDGDSDNAKKLISEVLAVQPDIPQAWFVLGSILQSEGNTESAILILNRATELNPQEQYYTKLGELYFTNQNWKLCLESLSRVSAKNKLRLPSKFSYLRCLFYNGDFAEAMTVGGEINSILTSESRFSKNILSDINYAINNYSDESVTNLSREQLNQYVDTLLSIARKLSQQNFSTLEVNESLVPEALRSVLEYDLDQVRKLF